MESHDIYLGRGINGDARSGNGRSTLVLGPSRSGKTTSLVIPNLLMATSAAVSTSTKNDVAETMSRARSDVPQLLYDPSGTVECPAHTHAVGFSFLKAATTWDGALLITASMAAASRIGRARSDDHWNERSQALMSVLLHAYALDHRPLKELTLAVDRRHAEDARDVLDRHYDSPHQSLALLEGILSTEERELSGIWSTTSGLLRGLRTDAARDAARRPEIDIEEFFRSKAQLHVVGPSRHQALNVPLVVGAIDQLVHHTYDTYSQGSRLLLTLDELANVAPLPQLPSVVSEGGGQGVVTLACLQDLSQARERWGIRGDSFLSLFPTAIVLPGIADRPTLELLSMLGGDSVVRQQSLQTTARGRLSGMNFPSIRQKRVSPQEVAQLRPGFGLGLGSNKQLRWIELTPSYRDARFAPYLARESRARSR